MSNTSKIGIHIFRRDMRLPDNNALHLLSQEVDYIIPIFIFDPYQVKLNSKNKSLPKSATVTTKSACTVGVRFIPPKD